MAGMIDGGSWWFHLLVAVALVVATGIALRAVPRTDESVWGAPLVAVAQLLVLLCLCVVMFTSTGVLGVFPGPSSLGGLSDLLVRSVTEIKNGHAPVPASPAILCLIVSAIGVVAIVVDGLVSMVKAPAVAGLLLLCVYAVPASLADNLLPWWSFVLGAACFALLLAVDRERKHQQWRGKVGLSTSGMPTLSSPVFGTTGVALVLALVAGATVTGIGTTGRLPGGANTAAARGPMGINPFTKLRGALDQGSDEQELFRVTGLPDSAPYLRAVTLSAYDEKKGWSAQKRFPQGDPLTGALRLPPGARDQPTVPVKVQPVGWRDNWLPLFGVPRQVSGTLPKVWRYDRDSGTAFSVGVRDPGPYVEQAQLETPTPQQLEHAPSGVDGLDDPGRYTDPLPVDPGVRALTNNLTRNDHTTFDKARALYRYFTEGNRFTYAVTTAPQTVADPVADFVLHGKTGYCEQFASAMAVMLRSLHIPTRVAVGFTAGTAKNGYRSITTKDAHAWVEVYFPDYGWMSFDPTPLSDGRTFTPPYLRTGQDNRVPRDSAGPTPNSSPESVARPKAGHVRDQSAGGAPQAADEHRWWPPLRSLLTLSAPAPAVWTVLGLLALAGGLTGAVFVILRGPRRRSSQGDTHAKG
jgi:hypothetical protein